MIVIKMMIILTLSIFIYPEVGIVVRCSEVKRILMMMVMMMMMMMMMMMYPEIGIMVRCSEVKSVVEILRSCRTSRLVQLETKTIMMV